MQVVENKGNYPNGSIFLCMLVLSKFFPCVSRICPKPLGQVLDASAEQTLDCNE